MKNRLWVLLTIVLAASTSAVQAISVAELVFVGVTGWIGSQAGREFAKNIIQADKQEKEQLPQRIEKANKKIADLKEKSLEVKESEKANPDFKYYPSGEILSAKEVIQRLDEQICKKSKAIAELKDDIVFLDRSLAVDEATRIKQGEWIGALIGVLAGMCMVHSSHQENLAEKHVAIHQAWSNQFAWDVVTFAHIKKIDLASVTQGDALRQDFIDAVAQWARSGRPSEQDE